MPDITINSKEESAQVRMIKKIALEKLERNLSKDNLLFLSELSDKPGINETLASKKTLIKTFI